MSWASDTPTAEQYLLVAEAAAELRCSRAHAYKLLNGEVEGLTVLPHLKLGRKKVVPRSQFEAWKRQNIAGRIAPTSELNAVDAIAERRRNA